MDTLDAHMYIIEKYGRREANYFDKYMIPRYSNMKIAYEEEFRLMTRDVLCVMLII